jgi:hypothetical protein
MDIIITIYFRKQEKRRKIEENRRLKQIHDNNQDYRQHIKRDVII